jgi:predicted ATPase
LLVCRMVNISMQDGTSGASAHGCAYLGVLLGPLFHRYREGFCFTKLACDLVEKHGFVAYQAKAYHSMGLVALWTQPITTAINFTRAIRRYLFAGLGEEGLNDDQAGVGFHGAAAVFQNLYRIGIVPIVEDEPQQIEISHRRRLRKPGWHSIGYPC